MKRVLRSGATELHLTSESMWNGAQRLEFRDEAAAAAYLRSFVTSPAHYQYLRTLLYDLLAYGSVQRLKDGDVVTRVAQALARGQLRAARRTIAPSQAGYRSGAADAVTADGAGDGATPAPAAASSQPAETTWVALELVNEQGAPVAGERYRVRTSSDKTISGRLGKDGRARVEGVEPGTCSVTFPDLDGRDWGPAE